VCSSDLTWTQDEIQIALTQIKNKRTPEDIAKKLNRPVSDIHSKLKTIAADMYIKGDLSYDEIHEATGVEKNSVVISPSRFRHNTPDDSSDDEVAINVSIYDFPEECDTMINVNVQDNPEEVIVTVSVESPFSPRSICEYISTPIFSTCSRFAKIIS
jgi:hypothetical protein